ncbi:hypothetical protein [Streptomyces syringium]|uniref:hypothetical protein n=1 Tax=Streptomyces syringium TaxID=76729 RepID=UPI003453CFAF
MVPCYRMMKLSCPVCHAKPDMGASGTEATEEKRAVWAARHFARAEAYDRLAVIEEPVAAERRRRAATEHKLAQDILRSMPAPAAARD